MKQRKGFILLIILFILLFLFLIPSLLSQDAGVSDIDKGYACLEQRLNDNCGNTRSTTEAAFNLLAISYDSNLQSKCVQLLNDKKNGDCFSSTDSGSCNVKSTAIAMLALNNVRQNVDSRLTWLSSKRKSDTGLKWYLEIDAINKTQCKVNGVSFTINEDKKISGTNPAGLQKAYNNYWFEIKDISKNYTISCDQNFISTLIYQKPRSNVFYVSGDTHSAPAGDDTIEKVDSYCFSTSNSCDYEGTLWAALALSKMGEDYSVYIPYISAFADENDNKKFLPYAFLQILSYGDDYYLRLIEQQKNGKYWEASGNRLYDSAIALLALNSFSVEEVENSRTYLFSLQEDNGCWQSDTSLILYSISPKSPSLAGSSGGGSTSQCEDPAYGYNCIPIGACSLVNTLSNFYCPSLSDTCCSVDIEQETCSEKLGKICGVGNRCSIGEVIASDTNSCCLGECLLIEEQSNECEEAGYSCQDGCFDNQEERTAYNNECSFGQICCGNIEKKSINWLLIIILIILIILVILAIIFRNRLRIWWFKRRSNFESKEGPQRINRPSYPPAPSYYGRTPTRTGQRQIIPRRSISRTPVRREGRVKDKEYEETMKRLRDITK